MSKELIINTIKKDFKGKAYDRNIHQCVHLTDDGKKCALGLFIPDGHPAQREIEPADEILDQYEDLLDILPVKNINFWIKFQEEHDRLNSALPIEKQKNQLIDWVNDHYTTYQRD